MAPRMIRWISWMDGGLPIYKDRYLQKIWDNNNAWIEQQASNGKISAATEERYIDELYPVQLEIEKRQQKENKMAKSKKVIKQKRQRRSHEDVIKAVKKAKQLITDGTPTGMAIKQAKLTPQQWYKHKDDVWPEIKSNGSGIKSYTRDEILAALNKPIEDLDEKLIAIQSDLQTAMQARDAALKAMGLA